MAGAITMGPMVQLVRADEALYDNLDVEGGVVMNGSHIIGPFFQPRDRFAAQPFFTSEHEAISSVTVKLQRRGNPTGPLEVEIWNDRNGKPNDLVASFGTIDLATPRLSWTNASNSSKN